MTRWDALLCSQNDRQAETNRLLRLILAHYRVRVDEPETGQDIAPIGTRWAGELITLQRQLGEGESGWDTLKTLLQNG